MSQDSSTADKEDRTPSVDLDHCLLVRPWIQRHCREGRLRSLTVSSMMGNKFGSTDQELEAD